MRYLTLLFAVFTLLGCEAEAQGIYFSDEQNNNENDRYLFARSLSPAEEQDSLFWSVYGKCTAALSIIETLDTEIIPGYEICAYEAFFIQTICNQLIDITASAREDWNSLKLIASGRYGYQKFIVDWRDPYVQQSMDHTEQWSNEMIVFAAIHPCGPLAPRWSGLLRMLYRMEYLVDDHLKPSAHIFQKY